jgi:hypothetical protein
VGSEVDAVEEGASGVSVAGRGGRVAGGKVATPIGAISSERPGLPQPFRATMSNIKRKIGFNFDKFSIDQVTYLKTNSKF